MSLTLNISPALYPLSRNPVWAKLTTNNYVTTTGVKAALTITGSGTGATATQTITLPFNGRTVVMTFAAALDGTGNTLRVAGVLSLANFMIQLAADFATNYYIADEYDITYDATHVYLTAKSTGSAYSFLSPATTATQIAIGTNTAGVTEVVRDNFKTLLDVYVEQTYKSGTFTKVHGQALQPISNITEFDIHDALHAELGIDRPDHGEDAIVRCENTIKQYYIRYAEQYGSDPVPQGTTQSSTFAILKGALSFMENAYTTSALSYFTTNQKFLTWQPRTKYITAASQEFLNFLIPSSTTSIKLYCKFYYTDGTTVTMSTVTSGTTAEGEVWTLPCGYVSMVEGWAIKAVSKYQVWVTNQSDVVKSETFTFKITEKPVIESKSFLFENSLSAWDTLRCTGVNEQAIAIQSIAAQKILARGHAYADGEFQKISSSGQTAFVQSTGYRTKAEIDWLEDLLFSKNVVEDIDGEYRPIIINTDNLVKYSSRQNLFAITFEYTHAFINLAPRGTLPNPDA